MGMGQGIMGSQKEEVRGQHPNKLWTEAYGYRFGMDLAKRIPPLVGSIVRWVYVASRIKWQNKNGYHT